MKYKMIIVELVVFWSPSLHTTASFNLLTVARRRQNGRKQTKWVQHLEHPVHARVVVQWYGGSGVEQEHPHAEHVCLADVHVGDRGVLTPRRCRARGGFSGDDFQVGSPDLRY